MLQLEKQIAMGWTRTWKFTSFLYWPGKRFEFHHYLQISDANFEKGAEIDSATVKGNLPIPLACGIYYYEVKIASKGRDGYIGIGITTSTSSQQRLPGKAYHNF